MVELEILPQLGRRNIADQGNPAATTIAFRVSGLTAVKLVSLRQVER